MSKQPARKPLMGSVEARVNKTCTTYRAIWPVPGKRPGKRTFDTHDQACDFLDEMAINIRRGGRAVDVTLPQTPFREMAEAWYTRQGEGHPKTATGKKQRSILNNHLLPAFGERGVGEITRDEIQDWVNKLALVAQPESVRNYHALLGRIFRDVAVRPGYLPNGMPLGNRLVKLPTPEFRAVFLEDDEVAKLLGVATEKYRAYAALVHLIAHTGLRRGEALALGRDQYRNREYLLIDRALKPGQQTGSTKTRRSRRVELFPCCVEVLDAHLAGHDYELIFPSQGGTLINPSNLRTRVWDPLVKDAGFADKGLHLHDLRHSHATSLLAKDWDVVTVAERLGHASPKMTLDRYGHAIRGRQRRLIDGL